MFTDTPAPVIGKLKVDFCFVCKKQNDGQYVYCKNCIDAAKKEAKKQNPGLTSNNYTLENAAFEILKKKAEEETAGKEEVAEAGQLALLEQQEEELIKNHILENNGEVNEYMLEYELECLQKGICLKEKPQTCKSEANKTKIQDNNTTKKENGGSKLLKNIKLTDITDRVFIRKIKEDGVKLLEEKIKKIGYIENCPIFLRRINGTYKILDGSHRYEAVKKLNLEEIPAIIIDEDLSDSQEKQRARKANEATETLIPTTFIDDAEFIWQEVEGGKTQNKIAEIMEWSREKVKDYVRLHKICKEAWNLIGATFQITAPGEEKTSAPQNGATAPFTENLLREILQLTPEQQLELVKDLISGKRTKGQFKTLAQRYKARNEMEEYALEKLIMVSEDLREKAKMEIRKGIYDKEWISNKGQSSGLEKLIVSIIEEWQEKNSIQLIHGDFYERVKEIPNGNVDLIITDPPYNISQDRTFTREGNSDVSLNFGKWDSYTDEEFLILIGQWVKEFKRILSETGSGYIFTSDNYLSDLKRAIKKEGMIPRLSIVWEKTNGIPQFSKVDRTNVTEYIVYFTKQSEKSNYILNELEPLMRNIIKTPACGGNERLKDEKGKTLHPTQKPEAVIKELVEASSYRGQTIFDGFMGVGTVAKVAKDTGRKFLGIEKEENYFEAAIRRIK